MKVACQWVCSEMVDGKQVVTIGVYGVEKPEDGRVEHPV